MAVSTGSARGAHNRLSAETSPYLLQHQDNPVDWWAWGPEAIAEAKRADKPILLSVGYAACHWCHVMAHESFEDPTIAAQMNDLFVNIKVDREERPDIDAIYQNALAVLGQQGGWPLTMFLTPDGAPFWGGTYFPPQSRWGRPGFPEVLRRIHQVYREEQDTVISNVAALGEALAKLNSPEAAAPIDVATIDRFAGRLVTAVDPEYGGLNGAPKFPQQTLFALIWRSYLRTGEPSLAAAVERTLTGLCEGGIYDHLGGGFARYSTDVEWLAPHFEKMLYDNALLVRLLTDAWRATRKPLYARRIEETIDWVLREMRAEGAGFASAFDADSEGHEGKFYVWSEAEIDAVLGSRAARFKAAYDVSTQGNWEGSNILNRLRARDPGAVDDPDLASCRALLFAHRAQRIPPLRDDKILTDWNALTVTALAEAGACFDRSDWIDAARACFAFLDRDLRLPPTPSGRLRHSYRTGEARHLALIEDHGALLEAALTLSEVTAAPDYLERARAIADQAIELFWDEAGGGFFQTGRDGEALIVRTKQAADHPTPSGNGLMAQGLAKLWLLTGEDGYRARAMRTVTAFAGEVTRNVVSLATLLAAGEALEDAFSIVIIGSAEEEDTDALRQTVFHAALPTRALLSLPPSTSLPTGHPAFGKGLVNGRPAAYVCRGQSCSLPITDPGALARQLIDPRHPRGGHA